MNQHLFNPQKFNIYYLLSLFCFFILSSCQGNSSEKKTQSESIAPLSSEETARQWQSFIDKNEFEAAKKLSTQNGIELIEMMELFASEEKTPDSALILTNFLSMNCVESGTSAICVYQIEEEGIEYQDTFFLVKEKEQWLIDIPEEVIK